MGLWICCLCPLHGLWLGPCWGLLCAPLAPHVLQPLPQWGLELPVAVEMGSVPRMGQTQAAGKGSRRGPAGGPTLG